MARHVLVGTGVATQRDAALEALTEVMPGRADLEAGHAAVARLGDVDDGVEMATGSGHGAGSGMVAVMPALRS